MADTHHNEPATAAVWKPRVLIVEETEPTRSRMKHLLRTQGYGIDEAVDGLEALRKLSTSRFDTIVLDLVLPRLDGWHFRQTQLRHPELACIPTVLVAGRPIAPRDRFELQASEIVYKPFEDETLLAAVDNACRTPERYVPQELLREDQLFWSKRGEVACWTHAPTGDSERWHAERWAPVPSSARKHGIVYQCQHCPGHRGPVKHLRRSVGPPARGSAHDNL